VGMGFGVHFVVGVGFGERFTVHKKPFNGFLPFSQVQIKSPFAKPFGFVFQYFSFPFSSTKHPFLAIFLFSKK